MASIKVEPHTAIDPLSWLKILIRQSAAGTPSKANSRSRSQSEPDYSTSEEHHPAPAIRPGEKVQPR